MRIIKTERKYDRVGRGFSSVPAIETQEEFTEDQYRNFISDEWCRFFNRYGDGAYCRRYKTYTQYGYRVYKVITVGPSRAVKVVVTFRFEEG